MKPLFLTPSTAPNPCGGGYAISAGLEQVIQYIKELHFDQEDIAYLASLGIFEEDFLLT